MAKEAFLINPYRKKRSRSKGKSKRRKGGLPGGLLSRMVKRYGAKQGMRMAWQSYRQGERKNPRPRTKVPEWVTSRHPKLKTLLGKRSKSSRSKLRGMGFSLSGGSKSWEKFRKRKPIKNPFGEEVIVVGANPRRKRKKRVSRRRTSLVRYLGNRGVRRRRSRGRRLLSNAPRRRRNLALNRRRRYRRNPARAMALGGGISLRRPTSLVVPIAVGLAARMATIRAPLMLGVVSPLPKYGIQAGVALGGGLLLKRVLGNTNAMVWAIVSGVTILENILNDFVFSRAVAVTAPGAAGMGYYEPEGVGAFPEEGMGAYPYEGGY